MTSRPPARGRKPRARPAPDALPDARAMLHALGDAAWIVEARTLVLREMNAAAAALLGVPNPAAAVLHAASVIATPEDQAFWADVQAGHHGALQSQTAFVAADGRLVHAQRRIAALGGDAPSHYLVVVHDRSEQLREQDDRDALLAELQATLQSTGDGILVTDLHGGIRAFNQRFAEVWKLPQALLAGEQDDAVFDWMRRHVSDPRAWQRQLAALHDSTILRARHTLHLR